MDSKIELSIPEQFIHRSLSYQVNQTHHIFKCRCKKEKFHKDCKPQCKNSSIDKCIRAHYWSHLTGTLNCPIYEYMAISTHSKDARQIQLDMTRTFPGNIYFGTEDGTCVLGRVLNRFSNYMQTIGYVQGINYICAALLWHTSEANAFWLLIKLMLDYSLAENFTEGLPGLMKHCEKIDAYVHYLWPDLHSHLEALSIMSGMYMTDWCITLFTNVIPIEKLGKLLSMFFEEGWDFFYKLSLEIIERLKKKILKLNDRLEVLSLMKPFQLYTEHQKKFLKSLCLRFEGKNWDNILKSASKRRLPRG